MASNNGNKQVLRNWTKIVTWLIIGLITYTIWSKMVPGAIEYVGNW